MNFFFILLFLFLFADKSGNNSNISNTNDFVNNDQDNKEKNNVFVGYKKWQNSQPFIAIKKFDAYQYTSEITLFCEGSEHVKISEDRNFKNADWLNYRKSYDWLFKRKENRRYITIFAIFRRKNPVTSLYEISRVVNNVIDLQNLQSKIEFTDLGIIDWTKGRSTFFSKVSTKTNLLIGQLEDMQRQAEENIDQIAFRQVSQIYYTYPYRIESFFKNNKKQFFSYLKNKQLKDIRYGSNFIQLNYGLSFFEDGYQSLFYLYQKEYQAITSTKELNYLKTKKKYTQDNFSNIVIDIRDYNNFKISLVPKVIDQQKNILFSPLFYSPKIKMNSETNSSKIDDINNFDPIINDEKSKEQETEQEQKNFYENLFQSKDDRIKFTSFKYLRDIKQTKSTLYIQALGVDSNSRIVISDRYKKYFLNSNNKNLIVLVN